MVYFKCSVQPEVGGVGMESHKTWNCINENHERPSLKLSKFVGMGN